jgi:hypothetical protein
MGLEPVPLFAEHPEGRGDRPSRRPDY